jgi:hypothetical protein
MSLIGPEARLQWRKAQRSVGNGACVELAHNGRQILVRDSQDQEGPVIQYTATSWRTFLDGTKGGRFDSNGAV